MKDASYAVMKLLKEISYDDPFTGETITNTLQGCAGYIPVFDTIEEAQDNSCDGKYVILAIQPEPNN